ncbi:MAG: glycosyltransferase family 4 protein [Methanosarcinales archaeon]|nr:MAG: glycosyltransferase family 4 protein [Methanosarcinales archaeon]
MRVCYFGSYNRNYSRNRVIIKGLKQNDVDVIECQDASIFWARCFKLFWKYLQTKKHDAIIVGAQGHANVLIAWFLSRVFNRRLVFDPFISLYDTAVFDRKEVDRKSMKAKYYYYLDKISCKLADVVIADTKQHAKYFSKGFAIPKEKIKVIYIGADDGVFYPREVSRQNNKCIVEFHGSFVPLQGVPYIIKAAKILEKENIIFKIIGKGQTYGEVLKLSKGLKVKNVSFLGWVNYENLPNYIAEADVCLGIFGDTEKAKRVIPNKAFEILAMRKPLITSDSSAVREVLTHEENTLLCEMADPESLAEAILTLKDDEILRSKIAEKGYRLYKERFTPLKIGEEVKGIVEEIC